MAVDPTGRAVFSACSKGLVKRWLLAEETDPDVLFEHSAAIRALACDPDAPRVLAGAEDGAVVAINLTGGSRAAVIATHARPVTAIACGASSSAVVGDYAGGLAAYGRDGACGIARAAFAGAVWDMSVSLDGTLLATASDDHSVGVWVLAGLEPIARFVADTPVYSVTFGNGGEVFAGAGARSGRVYAFGLAGIPVAPGTTADTEAVDRWMTPSAVAEGGGTEREAAAVAERRWPNEAEVQEFFGMFKESKKSGRFICYEYGGPSGLSREALTRAMQGLVDEHDVLLAIDTANAAVIAHPGVATLEAEARELCDEGELRPLFTELARAFPGRVGLVSIAEDGSFTFVPFAVI